MESTKVARKNLAVDFKRLEGHYLSTFATMAWDAYYRQTATIDPAPLNLPLVVTLGHQEVWARIWATLQGPNLCPQM